MKTLKISPLFILVIISLVGCGVPQEEYDELKDRYKELIVANERLKTTVEEQSTEISEIQQELFNYKEKERKQVERQNSKPYISEAKAIEYLNQDYEFYNRGYVYKDLKVLRVGSNEFKFSMREGKADLKDNDFFYVDQVKTLTVFKDGKYNLTKKIIH